MPYHFYLCGVEMPVLPAKFSQKVKSKNTTENLLDGRTINIAKSPGLTDVPVPLVFPMLGGAHAPDYYLEKLKNFTTKKKPTQAILTRTAPDGKLMYDTNIKVLIEDYNIVEDGKEGLDVQVDVSLREYVDYGTQTFDVKTVTVGGVKQKIAKITKERETTNKPTAKTHTIKNGETLWSIAALYLGSSSRFKDLVNANKDKITNPNNVPAGTVLTIPG